MLKIYLSSIYIYAHANNRSTQSSSKPVLHGNRQEWQGLFEAYMRVVLNSFMWKTPSSPEKKNLSPNFSEPHVYL